MRALLSRCNMHKREAGTERELRLIGCARGFESKETGSSAYVVLGSLTAAPEGRGDRCVRARGPRPVTLENKGPRPPESAVGAC